MPVNLLYVEGELDEELLTVILSGAPVVQRRGSKYGLQGIVVREREQTDNGAIFFLRDRDFDSEPNIATPHVPAPITTPKSGVQVGWIWFRHCIECYLLEPAIATAAIGRPKAAFEDLLRQAGQVLANYQAARWAIGQVRVQLPPSRHLATQPHQLRDEFSLPDDTSEQANWDWLVASTREFIQPITDAFHQDRLRQSFDNYRMRFSGLDVPDILVWYSGKDLLAFIARGIGTESPGQIRNRLRDWVRNNPDAALNLLPEWAALKKILNQ